MDGDVYLCTHTHMCTHSWDGWLILCKPLVVHTPTAPTSPVPLQLVHQQFPKITTRRLGTRGQSKLVNAYNILHTTCILLVYYHYTTCMLSLYYWYTITILLVYYHYTACILSLYCLYTITMPFVYYHCTICH